MQIHAFEVDGWDAKQERDRKMGSNIFCSSGIFIFMSLMRRSCHNRSVEISVEPRNFRRILDVYLLLFFQL